MPEVVVSVTTDWFPGVVPGVTTDGTAPQVTPSGNAPQPTAMSSVMPPNGV